MKLKEWWHFKKGITSIDLFFVVVSQHKFTFPIVNLYRNFDFLDCFCGCFALCSRFVLNVPKEDQQSFERILFLVEYAHWFYEDNSVEKNPSLKSLTLKEFTSLCILQELHH